VSLRARVAIERVALILLGAAIEWLATPPGPAPALVFVQDVPFLLLLWHRGGRGWGRWAWAYAFVKFATGLHWIVEVHWTMVISAPFVLAFGYLLWGFTVRTLVRRGAPYLATVGVTAALEEMLQTVIQGASGMPWPARSLVYTAWPSLTGACAWFGAYGLSALGAATSAWASGLPSLLVADGMRDVRARRLVSSGLAMAALVLGAWWLGAGQVAEMRGAWPSRARSWRRRRRSSSCRRTWGRASRTTGATRAARRRSSTTTCG
jgi:hypothetical protein